MEIWGEGTPFLTSFPQPGLIRCWCPICLSYLPLACKERKCGGTSASRDENGQMCGVKLKDRLPSKELRERLGVDDIALILQQNRLRWYGHVQRKDDDVWVKKCMEYEVEGSRPRGRPKRTWKEVVWEDCQARKLTKEDALDRCKWRKVIEEVRWPGWVWAGECFFWSTDPAYPGRPGQTAVKWLLLLLSIYWLCLHRKEQGLCFMRLMCHL